MAIIGVEQTRKFGQELREFLLRTNMLSMALGIVIGTAVTKVVNSVVNDLIMPIVGVITPAGNWRDIKWSFWRFNFSTGSFMGALLDFCIIATVVFLVTKAFVKNVPPPAPLPSKVCPECRESIHPEATRCRFCTTVLAKVS